MLLNSQFKNFTSFRTLISRLISFVIVFVLSTIATFNIPHAFSDTLTGAVGTAPEVAQSALDNKQRNNREYLVLAFSYDLTSSTKFTDKDCSSAAPAPAALYGCGTGNDGRQRATYGDFGNPIGLEIGLGFRSPTNWRYEFTIQNRPDISFSGNANFNQTNNPQPVSAKLSTLSFMVSGYFDLVGSDYSNSGGFTPYIGAGLGLTRINIGPTTQTFTQTATIVPGGTHTSPSWLIALGVSKELEGLGTLDLSWRYMDFGRVETPSGPGKVVRRSNGSCLVCPLNLAQTQAKLTSNGIRIALRRNF